MESGQGTQGKESARKLSQCCSLFLPPVAQLWGNGDQTLLWITPTSGSWIQFHAIKTRLGPSCLFQIYEVFFAAPAFQQVYCQQLLTSTAGLVARHNSSVYLLGILAGLPCCWHWKILVQPIGLSHWQGRMEQWCINCLGKQKHLCWNKWNLSVCNPGRASLKVTEMQEEHWSPFM